jgi:hypothetical protein
VFKRLAEPKDTARYRWDALLNPAPQQLYAVASAAEQQARTITPPPGTATKKPATAKRKKN